MDVDRLVAGDGEGEGEGEGEVGDGVGCKTKGEMGKGGGGGGKGLTVDQRQQFIFLFSISFSLLPHFLFAVPHFPFRFSPFSRLMSFSVNIPRCLVVHRRPPSCAD